MSEVATWLQPGAEVYVLSQDYARFRSLKRTTIARVMKRDVVTAEGERFRVADERDGMIRQSSGGTWSGASNLLVQPADPRIEMARTEIRVSNARSKALGLVDELRRGAMSEATADLARRAAAALVSYADCLQSAAPSVGGVTSRETRDE